MFQTTRLSNMTETQNTKYVIFIEHFLTWYLVVMVSLGSVAFNVIPIAILSIFMHFAILLKVSRGKHYHPSLLKITINYAVGIAATICSYAGLLNFFHDIDYIGPVPFFLVTLGLWQVYFLFSILYHSRN